MNDLGHKNGFNPYDILPKERIGPWGGWTASPIELLRFLVSYYSRIGHHHDMSILGAR
jgi:hypothetical protein